MLISIREIYDYFLQHGIQIIDHCDLPQKGMSVVFGDHPNGCQILELWDSKEIVSWFWMENFNQCLTAVKGDSRC